MNQSFDDQDIVSLYKKGATEVPPNQIDSTILSYAKSNSKTRRHWWPYIGLAASICTITLLAPWQWQEDAVPVQQDELSVEMQLMAPPVERAIKAKSSREVAPAHPFMEIDKLLAQDKVAEAREELRLLLADKPELEEELPERLRFLLEE